MKILRLYLATDLHRQSTVIKLDLKKTFKNRAVQKNKEKKMGRSVFD